jgi:hypothetical protein
MRLVDEGSQVPAWTRARMAIEKGERQVAQVRFMLPGASCGIPMKLDPADSLIIGDAVQETPIVFTAND